MIRALVWKELREAAGIAAVFLALWLAYVAWNDWIVFSRRLRIEEGYFPFQEFTGWYPLVAVCLAIALGYRQSAIEPARGTALSLFHRPLGRSAIVLTKLGTGLALQTALLSLPILAYGLWAAIPGHIPAPFEWSMAGKAFRIVVAMLIVYLAAFSSGINDARWIGGRLLPLLAATAPAILVLSVPWWWVFGAPAAAFVCAWFISNILMEARTRDF